MIENAICLSIMIETIIKLKNILCKFEKNSKTVYYYFIPNRIGYRYTKEREREREKRKRLS